jgi:RNase adapter protein RapZ
MRQDAEQASGQGNASMLLVVISGLSGSGKSVALNVLEDADFYCVDNLPAPLLAETVEFLRGASYENVAVTVDARSGESLRDLPAALDALRSRSIDVRLIVLNARVGALVRRFSETRRKHPLGDGSCTLEEAIGRERELLESLADAGHAIDTSDLSPNALRAWIRDLVAVRPEAFTLVFESFGYKNGIPLSADLIFDVRLLPNPFYDPQLRPQTGLDPEVAAFLAGQEAVGRLEEDIADYLTRWLPAYRRDGRAFLTVALGCTGGQHRSVYLVERLAGRFRPAATVLVRHRELTPR